MSKQNRSIGIVWSGFSR